MKLMIQKGLVLTVAGLVYVLGEYLQGFWFFKTDIPNLCGDSFFDGHRFCDSPYLKLGVVFVIMSEWLFLVAVILLFANERGTRWFFKFSIVYVPVAALLVASVPATSSAFLSFGPFQEGVARILGGLYALAALGIVLVARVRERA